jgi:hypothetical protein
MKTLKSKETILEKAFNDIMYSSKIISKVLNEVYELGFANGFKQGNDNAKEVADFDASIKEIEKNSMTQEEKQLLLIDLCARLPYGVKCKIRYTFNNETTFDEDVEAEKDDVLVKIDPEIQSAFFDWYGDFISIENFKPYLRPISSMTEGEILEFIKIGDSILRIGEKKSTCILSLKQMDWLNAHHFDYRGLIPMGLALKAPEGMYKNE